MNRFELIDQFADRAGQKERYAEIVRSGLTLRSSALHDIAHNRAAPRDACVTTLFGAKLFVNLEEYVGSEIYLHGGHEFDLSALVARALREGDCFIDVGAHFGYFSVLASQLVGPKGKVLAIDPARRTLNYLRMNCRSLANVVVIDEAAWSGEATLNFQDFGSTHSALNTAVAVRWARDDVAAPEPVEQYDVRARTLDAICAEHALTPRLIKVDAESAELEVLKGMAGIMRNARPIVTFEAGDIAAAQAHGAPTTSDLIGYLRAQDYEVHAISPDGSLLPLDEDALTTTQYVNLVAVPNSPVHAPPAPKAATPRNGKMSDVAASAGPLQGFRTPQYVALNEARLAHADALLGCMAYPCAGKRVLELGAGIGDHTQFWLDRGCEMVVTEPRAENLEALRERFPRLDIRALDLDHDDLPVDKFDIVYAFGVLHHLNDPARAIAAIAHACTDIALIETCVSFGEEADIHAVSEPLDDPTQAVSGHGCRPTRRWIFDMLKQHFEHVYQPSFQPTHDEFPTDWSDPSSARAPLRRTTFIASRRPLAAPEFFAKVLPRQTHRRGGAPEAANALGALISTMGIDCLIDVGANQGQFARYARQLGYRGRIVSFEPLAEAADRMEALAAADPLWEVHRMALGSETGVRLLHVSGNSMSSSFLEIEPRTTAAEPVTSYVDETWVNVCRLDDVWQNLIVGTPASAYMLKLDVQGSEWDVIEGATDCLDNMALVLMECSLVPVYHGEVLLDDMIARMRDRGFHPVWIGAGFRHRNTGQVFQCDVAFCRSADVPEAGGA